MSKLPRITSTRTSNNNTEIDSTNGVNDTKEEQNLILPNINQDNDIIRNPLVINTKIAELETKLLILEQNYDQVYNKMTQNEIKVIELENNFSNNPNISIKQTIPSSSTDSSSTTSREIAMMNNKIKYIEQILKNDQEQRLSEKQKELDFNKMLFNKINSSLTNTIQLEVEQRFKADLLQKNSNKKEIDFLQSQISNLKAQFEQMKINLNLKKYKIKSNN